MSENRSDNKNSLRLTRRGRAVAAIGALTLVGGVAFGAIMHEGTPGPKDVLEENLRRPDALQEYLKGDNLPHDKVVRLEAPQDMVPWAFAKMIKNSDSGQWELSQQIQPQADAQYYPGLQGGEQVVVERALVSEEAIAQYGVPEPGAEEQQ